jgi:NhaA family Na+:H+ antiporter
MWYFMLHSGIHATITGVLLAFAIPFDKGDESSISIKLQHFLHRPVAYLILPLFALANTAILLNADFSDVLTQANSLGIALGLIIGKPLSVCFQKRQKLVTVRHFGSRRGSLSKNSGILTTNGTSRD